MEDNQTMEMQRVNSIKWVSFFLLFVGSLGIAEKRLPDEQNNIDVYQKCSPAVVNITTMTLRQDFFFEVVPQQGMGSGAVIRSDGYIVTNDHVVGNAQKVEVTFSDRSSLPAKIVGTDPDNDIAVLKVEAKDRKFSAIDFGNPDTMVVGQKVLAIGNPFGLGGSLSVGVVSSVGRDIRSPTGHLIKDIIQTDAAINPGNSGGPLLDSVGKLIGINAQIVSRSGGSEGIGFAISIRTVKKIVDQLIQFGYVVRPDIGVEGIGLSAPLFQALGIPTKNGVMLTGIFADGPAGKAGLKEADQELVYGFRRIPVGGDVIIKIDTTSVSSMRDILDAIFEKKVGDTVTVHYIRGKVRREAKIKLAQAPRQ